MDLIIRGRFEPGAVVKLYKSSGLVVHDGELVAQRLADSDGSVGWTDLTDDQYQAVSLLDGKYVTIRCRPGGSSELEQSPVKRTHPPQGTGNRKQTPPPPAEPAGDFEVGIPSSGAVAQPDASSAP